MNESVSATNLTQSSSTTPAMPTTTTTEKPMKTVIDEIIGFSVLAVITFICLAVLVLCLWAYGKCYKRNQRWYLRCCPGVCRIEDSPCSSVVFDHRFYDFCPDNGVTRDRSSAGNTTASDKQGKSLVDAALKLMAGRGSEKRHRYGKRRQSSGCSSEVDSDDMAQATFGIASIVGGKSEYAKFANDRAKLLHNQPSMFDGGEPKQLNPFALSAWRYLQQNRTITSGVSTPKLHPCLHHSKSTTNTDDIVPRGSVFKVGRFTVAPSALSLIPNQKHTPCKSIHSSAEAGSSESANYMPKA